MAQEVTLGWPWPSRVPWILPGPGLHRSCQPVALPAAAWPQGWGVYQGMMAGQCPRLEGTPALTPELEGGFPAATSPGMAPG